MKRLAHLAAAALAFACGATTVHAAVILQVDVSDPATVTLTATTNNSQVTDSSATVTDGVDLVSFLTTEWPDSANDILLGDLAPPNDSTLSYNLYYVDAYSGTYRDLNLYYGFPVYTPIVPLQEFSLDAPAFTGDATADLSGLWSVLPAVGASGDIIAGDSDDGSHQVIGQWLVVPEPTAMAMVMLGAALLLRRAGSRGSHA